MCEIAQAEPTPGCLEITCTISGLPITETNEYGMFCAQLCQLEESKQAAGKLVPMIAGLAAMMEGKSPAGAGVTQAELETLKAAWPHADLEVRDQGVIAKARRLGDVVYCPKCGCATTSLPGGYKSSKGWKQYKTKHHECRVCFTCDPAGVSVTTAQWVSLPPVAMGSLFDAVKGTAVAQVRGALLQFEKGSKAAAMTNGQAFVDEMRQRLRDKLVEVAGAEEAWSTRLFSTPQGDQYLCDPHMAYRVGQGQSIGVPASAGAFMFGMKPWPTGKEPCADCGSSAPPAAAPEPRAPARAVTDADPGIPFMDAVEL